MRQILCTVILVCAVVTLAMGQKVAKKSAPVAKPAATADVQQILKDRLPTLVPASPSSRHPPLRPLMLSAWNLRTPFPYGTPGCAACSE